MSRARRMGATARKEPTSWSKGGDTVSVSSLKDRGDRDKLEAALLTWLHAAVARLEKEAAREKEAAPQEAGPQ